MAYYLGIDGGGTKTRCALGDETNLLATSMGGGSNVVRLGVERARQALQATIREVCVGAKISPGQILGICIGAAGAARPEVAEKIRGILGELTSAPIEVVGDTVIALEAAFGAGPGVIAIAGTGSIVYGRNALGQTARAGGWGHAISDEGSGQWIGRRAVWTILRALDEGNETKLTGMVLEAWKLHDLDELVEKANSVPPPEFPGLFPVVLRAANTGDPPAQTLLSEAGAHLAALTAMVIHRLLPQPPHAPVAMTGSVFRQSAEVRQVFYNQLQANFPGIEIRSHLVDPVEGALTRARRVGQPKADPDS
jgi:glucosamine kinase